MVEASRDGMRSPLAAGLFRNFGHETRQIPGGYRGRPFVRGGPPLPVQGWRDGLENSGSGQPAQSAGWPDGLRGLMSQYRTPRVEATPSPLHRKLHPADWVTFAVALSVIAASAWMLPVELEFRAPFAGQILPRITQNDVDRFLRRSLSSQGHRDTDAGRRAASRELGAQGLALVSARGGAQPTAGTADLIDVVMNAVHSPAEPLPDVFWLDGGGGLRFGARR
jgi:hypothetical protein